MALAQNQDAMNVFAGMNEEQKKEVIHHSQTISSKAEMHQYVMELTRKNNIL